jgi:hypothetical protein
MRYWMGHFSLFVNGARWKMVNLFLVWTSSTIHLSVNGFSRWGHFHSGVECWVYVAQPQMNVRQWSTFILDIDIKMTHSTWLATQSLVSWLLYLNTRRVHVRLLRNTMNRRSRIALLPFFMHLHFFICIPLNHEGVSLGSNREQHQELSWRHHESMS